MVVINFASENRSFSSREFAEYLDSWLRQYPIITIEDGLAGKRLGRLGNTLTVIGK